MRGELFKGVVALCNTGVLLLQRNRHEQARYTFQVALKVITSTMDNDGFSRVPSLQPQINPNQRRDDVLTLVWNLDQKGQQQLLYSADEKPSPFVEICALSDRVDPTVLDKYLVERSDKALVFIINIASATQSSFICPRQESEVLSAILLQNIASTFLCQALDLDCLDEAIDMFLCSAYRLYSTSQKILCAVIETKNSYILPEVAVILSSVLRNMNQTGEHIGDTAACQALSHKLRNVLSFITRMSLLGIYNSHLAHASVA
jgi:hypothetical protein